MEDLPLPPVEKKPFWDREKASLLLFGAFVLFQIAGMCPGVSLPEKCSLDDAWIRVFNWVWKDPFHAPELVFTYGPLGSAFVPLTGKSILTAILLFLPGAFLLRGLFQVREKGEWLFLFFFFPLTLSLAWNEIFLLLFPFLLWERAGKEGGLTWKDRLFFGVGAGVSTCMVLAKFQYFPLLLFAFLLAEIRLACRKKAGLLLLQFGILYFLFYKLFTPAGRSFPEYFRGSMEILTGFQSTMVWFDASPIWLFLLLFTASGIFFLTGFYLFRKGEGKGWEKLLFLLLLGAGLFVSYKYGAVRGDAGHIGNGLLSMGLLAGSLAVKGTFFPRQVRAGAIGFAFLLLILVSWRNIPSLPENMGRKLLVSRLFSLPETGKKNELLYLHSAAFDGKGESCDSLVPDGNGKLFRGNFRYTPRPIFHSYSAYTPYLIERNRSFLTGKDAPTYLLYRQTPPAFIAGTTPHPMLGDHSSMLLAGSYTPLQYWGKDLLLRKKASGKAVTLVEKEKRTIAFGEELLLPEIPEGQSLYCRIVFAPTLWGELLKFIQRPVIVQMESLDASGKSFLYDIPGRMGEKVFLLSPHPDDTSAMEKYLKGERLPAVKKIRFMADHRFFSRGKGGNPLDLQLGRLAFQNKIELTFYCEDKE